MNPEPTKEEALAAVKALVANRRRVIVEPRCQKGIKKLKVSADDVLDAFENATIEQIRKSEPDEKPERHDWIVVFRFPSDLHARGIYAKVALTRPHLRTGRIIQFKPSKRRKKK